MRSVPDNTRLPPEYWADWNPACNIFKLNGTEYKVLHFVGCVTAALRKRYVDVTVLNIVNGIPKERFVALFDDLLENYDKTMERLPPAEREAVRRLDAPHWIGPIGPTLKTTRKAFNRLRQIGVLDFNEEGHVGITDRAHKHNPRYIA
jgi:hypothetical protein